jgi:hypothetical protein
MTAVVVTGVATAASITSARCNHDAQISGTTHSERWTINVIAGYSTTTIAMDDD